MILHDLKQHGGLRPLIDIDAWLHENDDNVEQQKYFMNLFKCSEDLYYNIMSSAAIELRKPLVISDFIRPKEPQEPNITELYIDLGLEYPDRDELEEELGKVYDGLMKLHKVEHDKWENWQPLFDGFERDIGNEVCNHQVWVIFCEDTSVKICNDSNLFYRLPLPTREDFLRVCKEKGIELFSMSNNVDKDTDLPQQNRG